MKLIENRKFAAAVLAVCAVGSIVGFGGGSLAAQRSDAMRIFNEGVETSFAVRFSMDAYLENCAGYARTMAEEYRLHVDAQSDSAAEVIELASKIGDGDDLDGRYEAYRALCDKVDALYTDFHASAASDGDRAIFDNAYSNYQGEVSKIKYDEYHVTAAAFNQERQGFPAGAVSALLGLESLNEF